MKAVMYGAGNIGRGFVGALFSQAGYEVTFVDVVKPVIEELNRRGSYPLRIISDGYHEDILVSNIRALDGSDRESAARAIAEADIMATAVGANNLKFIAENIANGIKQRFLKNYRPLDILICENLMDADKILAGLVKDCLDDNEIEKFESLIGFVETSIGRMVPVQTDTMKGGDSLRICTESYNYLPVDKDAFKGEIPKIKNIIPYTPFGFYLRRKLYIHNMGHALCAYLGLYIGETYIYQAISNAAIQLIVKNAMLESMEALCRKYNVPASDILHNIDDLIARFTNTELGDTCLRVGDDTKRKLAPSDRLIGAAQFCMENDISPAYITVGAAAALHRHLLFSNLAQTGENAKQTLIQISNLSETSELFEYILKIYQLLQNGTSPTPLLKYAQTYSIKNLGDVV